MCMAVLLLGDQVVAVGVALQCHWATGTGALVDVEAWGVLGVRCSGSVWGLNTKATYWYEGK